MEAVSEQEIHVEPIQFSFQPIQEPEIIANSVEEPVEIVNARTDHQKRAERFGIPVREPNKKLLLPKEKKIYKNPYGTNNIKTGFDIFDDQEKEKKMNRAQRFNLETTEKKPIESQQEEVEGDGMELDPQEDMKEITDPNAEVIPNSVYIYGTDKMSTKEVFQYFTGYGASTIEWINDSSCNVLFEDEFNAKRAIEGNSLNLASNPENPLEWRKSKEWRKNPISLRFSTTEDVKPIAYKPSAYYYQQSQKKIAGNYRTRRQQNLMQIDQKPRSNNKNKNRKRREKPKIELTEEEKKKYEKRSNRFGIPLKKQYLEKENESMENAEPEITKTNTDSDNNHRIAEDEDEDEDIDIDIE